MIPFKKPDSKENAEFLKLKGEISYNSAEIARLKKEIADLKAREDEKQPISEKFSAINYERNFSHPLVPRKMFFTNGVGRAKEYLKSFEIALKDAGIAHCNLVNVSSILPPHCKILPRSQGVKELKPGQIAFVVMARNSSNEPNRLMAASIGVAIPSDPSQHGYLSEHHSFGETDTKAGEYAEDLAASMLASTLGIEFDPNAEYDQRKEIYKLADQIVRTNHVTQSAVCDKNGLWTTVVAAAVLLF